MKVKTTVFKRMLGLVEKGAGYNKLLPISSMVKMEAKGGVLRLTTTNNISYFTVEDKGEYEDFSCVVDVQKLNSLVSKTDSEEIKLSNEKSYLLFEGNGSYKFDLYLDERGLPITFPVYGFDPEGCTAITVQRKDILDVLSANKSSLAVTSEIPSLMGYHFLPGGVLTSNRIVACMNNREVFHDREVLLDTDLVELLGCIPDDTFVCYIREKVLYIEGETIEIYSKLLWEMDKDIVARILQLVSSEFKSSFKVNRNRLVNSLERLTIFTNTYDLNAVYFDIMQSKVYLGCGRDQGKELLLDNCVDLEKKKIYLNASYLLSHIKAQEEEELTINYSKDFLVVQIVGGNITQVICGMNIKE